MRTEQVELTVLCLAHGENGLLLQNRRAKDWAGYALPGGHVELGESIVDAVKREMLEETGLAVEQPRLCGVKQFPIENGRYLVFLFETTNFSGELRSSSEGEMRWVSRQELATLPTVDDFDRLLEVMLDPALTEFQYILEDNAWKVLIK